MNIGDRIVGVSQKIVLVVVAQEILLMSQEKMDL